MRLSARLFHALSVKRYTWTPGTGDLGPEWHKRSTERFIRRFDGRLDVRGKDVLDVGCGTGDLAATLARDGARRVVGVDIQLAPDRLQQLAERYGAQVAAKVELVRTSSDMHELGEQQFDLVFSKEAMEHYDDPESFVPIMAQHVAPQGSLVIGFGPLWKSFDGGHMDYMTKVPWAHLMFPEDVIMGERRRFRPMEDATNFGEILGGLNRMTLERFESIMAASGLRPVHVKHNAGEHPAVKAMDKLARIPPLREYFTNNVYGIWTKP